MIGRAVGYRKEMASRRSEGAPVPRALQALCDAASALGLRASRWCRSLDRDSCCCAAGALAVGAARTEVLPLAKRAVAAVAGTMQFALGMEACELIETNLLRGVLPTEDAATLPAVVAPLEEAEGL